jgi:hypothetical protein
MNKHVAIVTLLLGDCPWSVPFIESQKRYAQRIGVPYRVVTEPLDTGDVARSRHPSWQKCLIPLQPWTDEYEQLLIIDADVFVTEHALNIFEYIAPKNISGSAELVMQPAEARRMYRAHKMPIEYPICINGGVIVMSPWCHREIYKNAYYHKERWFVGTREQGWDGWLEQPEMAYGMLSDDSFFYMDGQFNRLLYRLKDITEEEMMSYYHASSFLHWAGGDKTHHLQMILDYEKNLREEIVHDISDETLFKVWRVQNRGHICKSCNTKDATSYKWKKGIYKGKPVLEHRHVLSDDQRKKMRVGYDKSFMEKMRKKYGEQVEGSIDG